MKYVATYQFSTQVTEDSYRVVTTHLELKPETTVREIMDWKQSKGVTTPIQLTIEEVEQNERPS